MFEVSQWNYAIKIITEVPIIKYGQPYKAITWWFLELSYNMVKRSYALEPNREEMIVQYSDIIKSIYRVFDLTWAEISPNLVLNFDIEPPNGLS